MYGHNKNSFIRYFSYCICIYLLFIFEIYFRDPSPEINTPSINRKTVIAYTINVLVLDPDSLLDILVNYGFDHRPEVELCLCFDTLNTRWLAFEMLWISAGLYSSKTKDYKPVKFCSYSL